MAKTKKQSAADEKLVDEAHKRFARCEDAESEERVLWKEDLRFANGDPDNGWQWDEQMRKSRELDKRPCLTINKTKQHNRQITNDARQNKPTIRVYPVDGGADKKTAEILNGVIRHIEANSSADTAYDTAEEFAVDAGLGYWRVITDYASNDSFDQEIFIETVKNPLNIYLDPDIQKPDGSDARFAFVFKEMLKDEFEALYPDCESVSWPIDGGSDWLKKKDHIRLAEYYKRSEVKDTLYADEQGNTILASGMHPEMLEAAKARGLPSRPVKKDQIKWYLIAGDKIIDSKDWPGRYIPIVRVVGEEVEVDGKMRRKGHTRALKDAQRMYNYNSSAAIEYGALQTKTPIIATAEAIEGYEEYWNNANTQNLPYLPYNASDATGTPLPIPQRMVAPAPAQLFLQGMQTASEEMKMASGQYDASMGAKSNETSGRAILARQSEGDTATFHFIDNVARSIKYTGKILIDLIPKIYDTERVIRILGEDGKEEEAKINPNMGAAYAKRQNPQTREVEEIYNPSIGRYDVTVAVGPSYSTKRQEAFTALTEMSSRNPQLLQVAGDIIMKAADFPMADKLAERLEKTLPPNLKDEEGQPQIPPEVQQQIQQMGQALENAMAEVETLEADKDGKDAELKIKQVEANTKAYEAITRRLQVLGPLLNPVEVQSLAAETQREAMEQPDPGNMPSESMGIPEVDPNMMQPNEPAPAGFFTPEQ
jgi:hypothetical protein